MTSFAAFFILTIQTVVKADIDSKNHTNQASVANIVPRFPAMQFHAGSFNGTHFSANGTLTGVSTGISTSTIASAHCPDETYTQPTNETYAEPTTTIKKTRTETRTLQRSTKGTTVSSALAVPGTQSVNSSTSQ